MNKKYLQKKLEKIILDTAIKLAKQNIGSLAVLELGAQIQYIDLFDNDIKPFNILNSVRRYEILACVDGAVIIDKEGNIKSYCAKISNTKPFKNFGCRHAAAYTASRGKNLAILSSEEDHKVRIFKNGQLMMQIDPYEKDIEKNTSQTVNLLESIGIGTLSYIGIGALVPTLGLALIPGVIIFSSTHYVMSHIKNFIERQNKDEGK